MTNSPSLAPRASIVEHLTTLTHTDRRAEILRLTASDLTEFLEKIHQLKTLPPIFESKEIQRALEQRMEELGVKMDAREQWERLKSTIAVSQTSLMDRAEHSFAQKLMSRMGGWGLFGTGLLTVLSWFGFKNARSLKQSIETKGFLRTATEGAREHPIFAALVTVLGLKVGSEAYQYVLENRGVIEEYAEAAAGKTGRQVTEIIGDMAQKVQEVAGDAKNASLRLLVQGLAKATGGEYDETTGVVTIPNLLLGGQKTLKPPFITAWQASVRREGGTALQKKAFSLFVIEDRFDAVVRQTDVAHSHDVASKSLLASAAKRGQELLKQGVRPGRPTKESRELERLITLMIDADPDMQKIKPIDVQLATPHEIEERMKHVETEMHDLFASEEAPRFKKTGDTIRTKAMKAQQDLASGSFAGDAESLKAKTIQEIQIEIDQYNNDVNKRKVALGDEYAALLSEHAKYKLDTSTGGASLPEKALDGSVKQAEGLGYKFTRSGPGKWIVRGITGYSFIPLALEGTAALRSDAGGDAAKKAFALDAGEAIGGFIPGVGEALDFRSAIMGTDMNGRELDTWQRVSAAAMGTLGTASIVAGFFTGGTSIVAFRALRGAAAARKAAKVYKAAKEGVEIAGVTAKAIKALDVAKDSKKALETMETITNVQRHARRVQNIIHNAQRLMQLTVYTQLGCQIYSGVTTIAGNVDAFIDNAQARIATGANAVQSFIGAQPTDA